MDLYQTQAQFSAIYTVTVYTAGDPPFSRGLPGQLTLMSRTTQLVRAYPAGSVDPITGAVRSVASRDIKVVEKWKIEFPMTIANIGTRLRAIAPAHAGPISVDPLYGARPITPDEPSDGGSGGDSDARTTADMAATVVNDLRQHGRTYNRDLLRDFQRAAGIGADGIYGDQTRAALLRYVTSVPTVAEVMGSSGTPGGGGPSPRDSLTPGQVTPPAASSAPWIVAAIALTVVVAGAFAITGKGR